MIELRPFELYCLMASIFSLCGLVLVTFFALNAKLSELTAELTTARIGTTTLESPTSTGEAYGETPSSTLGTYLATKRE